MMQNTVDFEKVGQVIHGISRLDFVLTGFSQWLTGAPYTEDTSPREEKLKRRLDAASCFSSAQLKHPQLKANYVQVVYNIDELLKKQSEFSTSLHSFVDDDRLAVQRSFDLLAGVIEKAGFTDISASALRARGENQLAP